MLTFSIHRAKVETAHHIRNETRSCTDKCWKWSAEPISHLYQFFQSTSTCKRKIFCDNLDVLKAVEISFILMLNIILLAFMKSQEKIYTRKINLFYANMLSVHIVQCLTAVSLMFLHEITLKMDVVINTVFFTLLFMNILSIGGAKIATRCSYDPSMFTSQRINYFIAWLWTIPIIMVVPAFTFKIPLAECLKICIIIMSAGFLSLIYLFVKMYFDRKAITKNKTIVYYNSAKNIELFCYQSTFFVLLWIPCFVFNVLNSAGFFEDDIVKLSSYKISETFFLLNGIFYPILIVRNKNDVRKEAGNLFKRMTNRILKYGNSFNMKFYLFTSEGS